MIVAAQIRAARALLDISQTELGAMAKCSMLTVRKIERGVSGGRAATVGRIQEALEKAGVVFEAEGEMRDGGAGVRLRK